jgi:hypothetical protein
MPHVRLLKDSPEGGPGNVVHVSRQRAHDLVAIGHATRTLEVKKQSASRKTSPA